MSQETSARKRKLVVVGDIHHGPNLEQIDIAIERERPDLTIFVGDYFDQFRDHYDHARRTAIWLKRSLAKPNRVHLLGNHDLPYLNIGYPYCPGYDPAKERAIRSVLDENDWTKFRLHHTDDNWLYTHAGLSKSYAPTDLAELEKYLSAEETAAWHALERCNPHWIWSVGKARGGFTPIGGILWCDWDREFVPIPGLNQVVGHTPGRDCRVKHDERSENWCIDVSRPTGITQMLVIENNTPRAVAV